MELKKDIKKIFTIEKKLSRLSNFFHKLIKKQPKNKIEPKILMIISKGGIPLTIDGEITQVDNILNSAFLNVITCFVKDCFNTELNQVRIKGYVIFIRRSENFMGCLIYEEKKTIDFESAEKRLIQLLNYIETKYPEVNSSYIHPKTVESLIHQFSTTSYC